MLFNQSKIILSNNIAIIPDRGGSKRIPRKNIKSFLGKPIIAYSIEKALESNLFKEVMGSTDDEEIAEISLFYGAKVPFIRSSHNSNDYATTADVLNEVIITYHDNGFIFDNACCIYPAAPLIQTNRIIEGYNKFINGQFDVLFPAVPFSFPIWRGITIENDNPKFIWPEFINSRTQDLTTVYHDAGQWYWFKTDKINNGLLTGKLGVQILNEMEVQDIDNPVDWEIAELKYQIK